jgi:cell wall-associated NlpC family hydrolase
VPRKLTVTTGVVLALVFAGCGKDSPSGTNAATTTPAAAQSAATTPATTAPATTSTTKGKAAKANPSTDALPKTSTTAKTSKKTTTTTPKTKTTTTAKTATTPKKTTTTKKPVAKAPVVTTPTPAVAPPASSGADPSSGTGAGPTSERLAIVVVLRRYYKAFLDGDGAEVCSLLTASGREQMIKDGGKKTCVESVKNLVSKISPDNRALLETTRDGLHVDDITVTGITADAQIGKKSKILMLKLSGGWLVKSPDVVNE